MAKIIFEDIKLERIKKKVILKENNNFLIDNKTNELEDKNTKSYFKKKSINSQRLQSTPRIKKKNKILSKKLKIIFILILILALIYFLGNLLHRAKIEISSKNQIVKYNNKNFIATKNSNKEEIEFEIMIISDTETKKIILTEPKEVSIKSTGSVLLLNEFSQTPQKISAGTFLTDNEGKTYKTDRAVTIPGFSFDNQKKIVAGQASVDISSFLAGDVYNGEPRVFYVNAFKGTPKYNKIYGKIKDPLKGGASGLMYILGESDKTIIDNIAQSSIKNDLLNKVKSLVPPGYLLYPNAIIFSYTEANNIISKTPESEITIEGTLAVVLLKEESLINYIIKSSLLDITKEEINEIKMPDINKLTFNFKDKNQIITKDLETISFTLTGDLNLIWEPSIEILKTKLLGVKKEEVLPIFRQDKGITSASVKIFPPWQKYLPKDSPKIDIRFKKH